MFVFFQAEDGIRDAQESRGLGDVYKRQAEGYGISYKAIDYASENDYRLVIALDCGIKAVEKIKCACTKKIDFIICDHHRPGDELPPASAVLDPKPVSYTHLTLPTIYSV